MLPTWLQSIPSWLAPLGGHAASAANAAAAGVGQAAGQLNMASLLALAAALGWASGLRLYAVVFLTGLAGALGWLPLPPGLALLQHPFELVQCLRNCLVSQADDGVTVEPVNRAFFERPSDGSHLSEDRSLV